MSQSEQNEKSDEESFIVLDTSPGLSLKNSSDSFFIPSTTSEHLDDALEDMCESVSFALKSQVLHENGPSPASLMVASTIVTENKTIEDLQKSFGQMLDENSILRETLKQNNESMRDQLLLIASCQEDMIKTHSIHRDKFAETRELIEKLRQENRELKSQLESQSQCKSLKTARERIDSKGSHKSTVNVNVSAVNVLTPKHDETIKKLTAQLKSYENLIFELQQETSQLRQQCEGQSECDSSKGLNPLRSELAKHSGPLSGVEFVSSPDDDTIEKLTAQLELVEKQRREVIFENQKLTWQKQSLEHMMDVTAKERDELKEKVNKLEANLFEDKCRTKCSVDELQAKMSSLQHQLAQAKKRIMEMDSLRLELSKTKADSNELVRVYKEQMLDLTARLKEAHTMSYEPVRRTQTPPPECADETVELANYLSNVNVYEQTLKHLAQFLNALSHGMADCLLEAMGAVIGLQEYKLDKATAEHFKQGLNQVKKQIEKFHNNILENKTQLKNMLKVFEGIFNDYNQLLKKSVDIQLEISRLRLENSDLTKLTNLWKQHPPCVSGSYHRRSSAANKHNGVDIQALTAALVARGEEVQSLTEELARLHSESQHVGLLTTQLELYKSDFEMEREAREKIASEKDNIAMSLKAAEKKIATLSAQLEEVAKHAPDLYRQIRSRAFTARRPQTTVSGGVRSPLGAPPAGGAMAAAGEAAHAYGNTPPYGTHRPLARHTHQPQVTSSQREYKCPKCMQFKSTDYNVMEEHFDFCLDDF